MPLLRINPTTDLFYDKKRTLASGPRPWLLVMHPSLLDQSFIPHILDDVDIRRQFNLVCFDLRFCGRTKSKYVPTCDVWTLAADLVKGMQLLEIPPVHVLSGQCWISEIALRMALLFPGQVLSLALCGLNSEVDTPELASAIAECMNMWSNPEDQAEYEESIMEIQLWVFGPPERFEADLLDKWAATIFRRYSPSKSISTFGFCSPFCQRVPIPEEWIAKLDMPILAMTGEDDECYPPDNATDRSTMFDSVPGGVDVLVVGGAPNYFILTHYPIIKPHLIKFWTDNVTLPPHASHLAPAKSDFATALKRLSVIMSNPEIAKRDPEDTNSFYVLSQETIQQNRTIGKNLEEIGKRKFKVKGEDAKESWEGAPYNEEVPYRFSTRFN